MSFFENNHYKLISLTHEQALNKAQYDELSKHLQSDNKLPVQRLWLQRVLFMLGGMCLGLGAIFWIAANWGQIPVLQKFILAEAILALSLLLGLVLPRARSGFLLLAVFALGALLALYAQEYSSNQGPWRLFAIWAFMALPIALAAKHQAVWMFWWLVILLALSLWFEQSDKESYFETGWVILVSFVAWLAAIFFFYPRGFFKQWLGTSTQLAFSWSLATLSIYITAISVIYLFNDDSFWWVTNIVYSLLIVTTAYIFYRLRYIDKIIFSVSALCFNVIVVGVWFRVFASSSHSEGGWFFITLGAGGISLCILLFSIRFLKNAPPIELSTNSVKEVV